MTKFNNQKLISNYPNCTCINPKLNSNKLILCSKLLCLFVLSLLPLSMPFCILTSYMIPETDFCSSALVGCIPYLACSYSASN